MSAHGEQHEERILGLAIGDEEDVRRREIIRSQIVECEECLAYGYRVLADVPLVRAALRADAEGDASTATPEGLAVLEQTLSEAMEELAARDAALAEAALAASAADPAPAVASSPEPAHSEGAVILPFRRRSAVRWAATGLAMAAAAAVAVVLLKPDSVPDRPPELLAERDVPETFRDEQLASVQEMLEGMGFAGRGPSPFARGYAFGLLLDLAKGSVETPAARRLAIDLGELAMLDSRRPTAEELRQKGCSLLAVEGDDHAACVHGVVGYRIVRDLTLEAERPAYVQSRVRSTEAKRLLGFAVTKLPLGPRVSVFSRSVELVEARVQAGAAPDAGELAAWRAIVRSLLR